jgi:hypothetical protein
VISSLFFIEDKLKELKSLLLKLLFWSGKVDPSL